MTACDDADGKHGVYLITIDGKVIRKLSVANDRVGDPGFSPDGKFVVYLANAGVMGDREFDGGDIVVAAADGKGKPRRDPQADEQNCSWSPSGDEIAYESSAKTAAWPGPTFDRVWVMNSNGDSQRVLWSSGGTELGAQIAPSWSSR